MGAFDKKPDILIPDDDRDPKAAKAFRQHWGWDSHEQIMIKGSFTAADQAEMENASSELAGKGRRRNLKVKTGDARLKLLECMIVNWTLTESGRPVQVTAANISRLPANYRRPVLEKCDEIAMTMDEEEQEDFLDASPAPSQES